MATKNPVLVETYNWLKEQGVLLGSTLTNLLKVTIHDGYGNPISSIKGALNIHDAHVHNVVINKYAHQATAVASTLSVATVAGADYQITVTSGTGFIAGKHVSIHDGFREPTLPQILSVVGNVITLDRRLDFTHAIGATVTQVDINMATNIGTIATPQVYYIAPQAGEIWHINRLLFSMVHATAGDLGKFGDIAGGLINGVVLRAKNSGQYGTFTNWKTNGDIKDDMYDVEPTARSGGGGDYGTSGRGTFTEAGAVVRLDGDEGDLIEVHIQDDITSLSSFTMKFQGHIEGA